MFYCKRNVYLLIKIICFPDRIFEYYLLTKRIYKKKWSFCIIITLKYLYLLSKILFNRKTFCNVIDNTNPQPSIYLILVWIWNCMQMSAKCYHKLTTRQRYKYTETLHWVYQNMRVCSLWSTVQINRYDSRAS